MKTVLKKSRKYGLKDLLRILFIFFCHCIAFYSYLSLLLLIRYFVLSPEHFFIKFHYRDWLIFYPMIVAPFVNTTLHIIYSEKGSPWTRVLMWIHSLAMIVLIPIMIFIAA